MELGVDCIRARGGLALHVWLKQIHKGSARVMVGGLIRATRL